MLCRLMQVALMGGLLMVVGCEQEETTPTTPPPAPAAGTEGAASDTGAAMQDAAGQASDAASDAAAGASAAANDALKGASDATTDAANQATGAAGEAGAAASGEAQKLIDQAMTYIKENKLDLAEQTVTKLEGMKASLSPTLQSAVDSARKSLNAAKSMGGATTPPAPAPAQ